MKILESPFAGWLRFRWYWHVARKRQAIPRKIAWMLPRSVAMWAYIRIGAHATTGQYADTIVPELGMMEALERW
jgi:hypothetical protein